MKLPNAPKIRQYAPCDAGGEMGETHAVAMLRISSLLPVLRELERREAADPARSRLIAPLLRRHRLHRDMVSDPYAELPLVRYLTLLEEAAELTGDPLFGARAGMQFQPADLGPVGLICAASGSLRQGLQHLAQALPTWQDDTLMRVEVAGDTVVWSYRILLPDHCRYPQDNEFTLAATLALAGQAFGAAARPREIHATHERSGDLPGLTRILGRKPVFGQDANRLIFDRAAAEKPLRHEDRGLIAVLLRHLDDLRRPAQATDLISRVRGLIAQHLGQRPITLTLIADELNLSTRSLQRHLAEAGTALRPMLLQARMEMAQAQLRDGQLSNAEIARRLGYADGTGLWRAFKTATGSPPKAQRRTRIPPRPTGGPDPGA